MEWIIPILLFAAASVFWVLSYCTQDPLVYWCCFLLACFLLLLALIYAVSMAAQWVMS